MRDCLPPRTDGVLTMQREGAAFCTPQPVTLQPLTSPIDMLFVGDTQDLPSLRHIVAMFPDGAPYRIADGWRAHRETKPRTVDVRPLTDNAPPGIGITRPSLDTAGSGMNNSLDQMGPPYVGAASTMLPNISDATFANVLSPRQTKLVDSGHSLCARGLILRPALQGVTSWATTPRRQ